MDSFLDIVPVIGFALAAIVVYVSVWFVISRILKRNDVADSAWGPGILLVALVGLSVNEGMVNLLITLLIGVWALRLFSRITIRNARKKEDGRYVSLAASWGKWFFLRSYLQVFLLQGVLMVFVGYSALHAAVFEVSISWLTYVGVFVWLIGFFFETVGDYQLDQFLGDSQNKGKIMQSGLWKYSRHPNYFGEVTQWWGIFLIVAISPFWFVALISPLTITFLILKVSGIPMLEKAFEGNPEFEAYKKRTSAFFPSFPK